MNPEYTLGEFHQEGESPFSEAEEMELAGQLLEITSEEELDLFLGNLFKKAWKGIKKVGSVVGRVARPLGGILKGVAKAALPMVGGALGSFIPIPGVGTAVGTALGSAVSKALELEYAGLETEEREFEVARRFVRMAGAAAQQAAMAPPGADPFATAQMAAVTAARQQFPGIEGAVPGARASGNGQARRAGSWIRRGRLIIVNDV